MATTKGKVKNLTQSEILKKVVEVSINSGVELSMKQAKVILDSYEKILLNEWEKAGEFKFLSVGKFKTKARPAREGINPLTKQKVKYPAKVVPVFRFNKAVKEFIAKHAKK